MNGNHMLQKQFLRKKDDIEAIYSQVALLFANICWMYFFRSSCLFDDRKMKPFSSEYRRALKCLQTSKLILLVIKISNSKYSVDDFFSPCSISCCPIFSLSSQQFKSYRCTTLKQRISEKNVERERDSLEECIAWKGISVILYGCSHSIKLAEQWCHDLFRLENANVHSICDSWTDDNAPGQHSNFNFTHTDPTMTFHATPFSYFQPERT